MPPFSKILVFAASVLSLAPCGWHNGWATYYYPSSGIGACGWQNQDHEWVAGIGTSLFRGMMVDGNPNHSKACGKTADVTWNGRTITVGIVDSCAGCGYDDINLSSSAFRQFAPLDVGRLHGVSWKFKSVFVLAGMHLWELGHVYTYELNVY